MAEKTPTQQLAEKLLYKPAYVADKDADVKQKAHAFAEGYKKFLDNGKTEREVAAESEQMLKDAGYVEFDPKKTYQPGDKVYFVQFKKAVVASTIGTRSFEDGFRLVIAHTDSPRLDLRPTPLYESDHLSYFKTHYYGGIRKYQWVTIPLELHGVVALKNGEVVRVSVGNGPDDPMFTIDDLLPHLATDQVKKPLGEAIPAESLNILVGSRPLRDDEGSDRVKLSVLELLNRKYGIVEEDFLSAELCAVRWERVWTDSIVSLAVIVEYAEGTSHYYIYHFDCANSIELDSAHMLRRLGISMDDYTAAVRRAAAQAFDRQYAGFDPAIGGGAAYLLQLRAMTVAAAGNSDPVPFLPNEDGSLRIFPSIGSIAGAGWYMTPLTVSFGSAETGTGAPIRSNSGVVWAAITLDGTGLQVSFESSGKNYPVSGCYADYTALLAANIGPDAYVFALTAGGFVEAVNMTACSRFETFCSMGPLYGLSGITSLEAGNGTAYAVDAGGAKHALLPLVQSVESGFSAILSGAWEANREGDAFRLRFGEDGACTLEEARQGSRVTSTGALTVLGMGDGGLLCACSLTQPDGNELTAIWSIEPSFGSLQLCAFSGEDVLDIGADMLRFEPAQE